MSKEPSSINLSMVRFSNETGYHRTTIEKGLRAQGIEIVARKEYPLKALIIATQVDGKAERARLTKAQADREEIEVARLRGEMIVTADMITIMSRILGPTRATLVNFPSAMAARCNPSDPPIAYNALKEGIDAVIKTLGEDVLPKLLEEMRPK